MVILNKNIPKIRIMFNILNFLVKCHRQMIYQECGGDRLGCYMVYTYPNPGLEVTCGSELDWACSSERIFDGKDIVILHRDCVDLDSLDLAVKSQLDAGQPVHLSRHTVEPHVWELFYCSAPLCNNY